VSKQNRKELDYEAYVLSVFDSGISVYAVVLCLRKVSIHRLFGKDICANRGRIWQIRLHWNACRRGWSYRNCRCGYTIQKPQKGFLGTQPEKIFFICFDENGVAISCEEGFRPGG
jgi:hypothetical protein